MSSTSHVLSDGPTTRGDATRRGHQGRAARPRGSRQTAMASLARRTRRRRARAARSCRPALPRFASSTRQRRGARRVDARSAADARGDARRRQRVRPRTAHARSARSTRFAASLSNGPPEQPGQVFAFVGAKGGVGTTTLAVNTGGDAGARAPGREVLLDRPARRPWRRRAVLLGVEPRFSVLDALENVHRVDESFFSGLVEKTKAGRRPARIVGSDAAGARSTRSAFHALLDFAARKYRYTVLDVPRSDMAMLDALEAASTVVVVTSQELPSLRSAGRLAHMLRTRYGAARVKAVVNRFDRKAEIAPRRHRAGHRRHGQALIPSDYRVARRGAERRPAGRRSSQSRLADAFRAHRRRSGRNPEAAASLSRPASVFGRLALRRA